MGKLQALEGAVIGDYNPHDHVLRCPSPSINFAFGRGHGLPEGLTLALGGNPKGGKTLVSEAFVGQLHADDPTAIAAKFNTEFREQGQGTPESRKRMFGIDPERYIAWEVNSPMLIFDRVEKELAAYCQDGMPLKLLIIDSINGIQGRRAMNADTIETQQIGDWALTMGEGFKRILEVQRRFKFSLIFTCQIRMEMDRVEQMRGNKYKMNMPLAIQHYAEYFAFVEMNRNKDARTDLAGNEFRNEQRGDVAGKGDITAHKISFQVKESSCGPKGRKAEFTLDYNRGIINTHEEVFLLAKNRGVFSQPNNKTWEFGDRKWTGKENLLQALADDRVLCDAVMAEVYRRDGNEDDDVPEKAQPAAA